MNTTLNAIVESASSLLDFSIYSGIMGFNTHAKVGTYSC